MESKPKQIGGKREGAGRKPGPNVWVRLPVPREVWAMLEADAAAHGVTAQQEAARVLTQHVRAPLFSRQEPEE